MKPAAIYLRVSTQAQAGEDRFGKAAQLADCIPYAERAGLRVVRVYADTITGTRAYREQLERLVDDASLYEAVLISSVDRLARRVPIAYTVLGELVETGLEVHSTDMGVIDLDDDSSALNFGVRSVFADADHRKIVRRLRLGMRQKVLGKDGKPGRPVVPLNGYGFSDNEILESEAKWVRWAYERALEVSIYQVTRELNDLGVPGPRGGKWSDTTVKAMLRNPLYRGEYSYAKVRPGRKARPSDTVRCEVPAIVGAEAWERTQRALDSRRKGKGRTGTRLEFFPLMGRIKCGVCGGGMSGRKTTRKKYGTHTLEYYCYRSQKGTGQLREKCAHRRHHLARRLHDAVRSALHDLAGDPQALARAIRPLTVRPLDLRPERERVERQLSNARILALDGALSPTEYRQERERLEAQLAAIGERERADAPAPPVDLAGARAALGAVLATSEPLEAARALGLKVTVYPDRTLQLEIDG